MRTICSNRRKLFICDIDSFKDTHKDNWLPNALLFSAWEPIKQLNECHKVSIEYALLKGVITITCVGPASENLHDLIDNYIDDYDYKTNTSYAESVLTTYHQDESIEDSITFFIYGTEFIDNQHNCSLVLLDRNKQNDSIIKSLTKL